MQSSILSVTPYLRRVHMLKCTRIVMTIGMALLFTGTLFLGGCSSSPDEEQLKALQTLKDEVAQLEKEIKDLEAKKSDLEKTVAEKNAKMAKCNADQEIVKQRLAK
jgi:outer membrane murein-binding lipoprotein Lpp